MKVIDISSYQTVMDYEAVKNDGIHGVILRSIVQSGKADSCFAQYYNEFNKVGVPVAVYVFSYDLTYEAAIIRAKKVKNLIAGKNIKFVALDLEWEKQRTKGKAIIAQVIKAYIEVFEDAGIPLIGYWNLDWHKNVVPTEYRRKMKYWIARYPKADNGIIKVSLKPGVGEDIWQYSSKGKVKGIRGNVDLNECYTDLFGKILPPIEITGNPYAEPIYTLYRYKPLISKEYVKWLQYELNKIGYDVAVDGVFGKSTESALKKAQEMIGIEVDGKCGPITIKNLKKM